MRVLVTGGTGSIGAWVVHELVDRDITPIVFDIKINQTYLADIADDIVCIEGDITNYDEIEAAILEHDPDRIIHLAKLLPPRSEDNPLQALRVNVLGSGNLLKAASENGVRRVVFSSSKSVFSRVADEHGPPEFEPITEAYPKFDRTTDHDIPFYSTTNKMVEYYGIRYAMTEDLEFVILRFGSTWGPGKLESARKFEGDERTTGGALICQMIERAQAGGFLESAQGKTDNATYTKDIAQGVSKAVLSDDIAFAGNHREFLLDAGQTYSHVDFADVLNEMFPEADINVTEAAQKRAHRSGVQCVFDLSRAKRELDYRPRFTDIQDAVADYIRTEQQYSSLD